MIKIGIVGISGFAGQVLLDILLQHKDVRVTYVSALVTGRVDEIWPEFKHRTDLVSAKYDPVAAIKHCDLVFLALPHMESMNIVGPLLKAGKKVIDLSADYRLKKAALYQKWYGGSHKDLKNLRKAVYGLPEIFREKVKKTDLIANLRR